MTHGTCNAIDRESGRRCTLPFHFQGEHSASGRRFVFSLLPGEVPLRPLDAYAEGRKDDATDTRQEDVRARNRRYKETSRKRRMVTNREGAPK